MAFTQVGDQERASEVLALSLTLPEVKRSYDTYESPLRSWATLASASIESDDLVIAQRALTKINTLTKRSSWLSTQEKAAVYQASLSAQLAKPVKPTDWLIEGAKDTALADLKSSDQELRVTNQSNRDIYLSYGATGSVSVDPEKQSLVQRVFDDDNYGKEVEVERRFTIVRNGKEIQTLHRTPTELKLKRGICFSHG